MKNVVRKFALFALLTLCVLHANAQATSKTFSKAFNLNGSSNVILDLPASVELKNWENQTIRFVITVSLPSGNSNLSVIDQLSSVGRYDLELSTLNGNTTIEAKNLKRTIKVKGQDFKENVHIVVFAPKGVHVDAGITPELADAKK